LLPTLDINPLPTIKFITFGQFDFVFDGVLDSCSTFSIIDANTARKINAEFSSLHSNTTMKCGNKSYLTAIGSIQLSLQLGHKRVDAILLVVDKSIYAFIIGLDIINKYGIVPNYTRRFFYFDDSPEKKYPLGSAESKLLLILQEKSLEFPLDSQEGKIENLLQRFPMVARRDGSIGVTSFAIHKIEAPDFPIPVEPPRYYPPKASAEIKSQCEELLKNKLIRFSSAPYGTNVVLQKKPNGSMRMTVNYVELNKLTVKNARPIPKASIILRLLPTGGWFSVIDLRSGFWQIRMHPDSIAKTAFYGDRFLYEWLVMPFGLKNAPMTFISLMSRVLDGLIMKICFCYMDDIVVFSKTFEEHLQHIEIIFERLKEANLSINLEKSHFGKRELTFLGHTITQNGLMMQPEKLRAIRDFPTPTTVKKLLRFHGMCVWYSPFIKDFSSIASPLYKLLKKNVRFKWGLEQKVAFEKLKEAMCTEVTLKGLDYSLPIFVRTDASDIGLGAVLVQYFEEKERVIYFASKSLNEREQKLAACDKECLAIIWAINKFKDFLWGEEFTVMTDNNALTYLKAFHSKSRRLTRWAQEIEEWGCKIVHCSGKKNVVADCLSRAPVSPLPNEPDHLEGDRDIFTPVLALTYYRDLLRSLKEAQEADDQIRELKVVLSQPLATGDSSVSSSGENRKVFVHLMYKMLGNILHRKVASFDSLVGPSGDEAGHDFSAQTASNSNNNLSAGPLSMVAGHKNNNSAHNSQVNEIYVPVVPKSMIAMVLHQFHDALEGGHLGVRKTKEAIKKRFYWD